MKKLIKELNDLLVKHNATLSGNLKVLNASDYILNSIYFEKEKYCFNGIWDKSGEGFINFDCVEIEKEKPLVQYSKAPYGYNADAIMGDGIKSMADGKRYTSRKEYSASLKALGCSELGEQTPKAGEKKTDYNIKKEYYSALKQVLGDGDVAGKLNKLVRK